MDGHVSHWSRFSTHWVFGVFAISGFYHRSRSLRFFFFIISRSRLKFRNRFDGGGAYTVFCYSMIFFFAISLALQCAICLWNCAIHFGNFPSQRGVGLVSNPHASTLPFHIDFYCAATRYLGISFTKLQFEISTIFLSFRKTFHLSPTQNSVISQRPGMLSKLSRDSVTDCASLSWWKMKNGRKNTKVDVERLFFSCASLKIKSAARKSHLGDAVSRQTVGLVSPFGIALLCCSCAEEKVATIFPVFNYKMAAEFLFAIVKSFFFLHSFFSLLFTSHSDVLETTTFSSARQTIMIW